MEVDITYEFDLEPITNNDYKCSKLIVEWLKSNMENITDSNKNKLFSKVNYGYNEDTLKGFGKKTCL
jgi:3'-phosphoadenosine 5'-phosphosulfate (PAPS) 3'-phosphatase